jgi:hypothetical protein
MSFRAVDLVFRMNVQAEDDRCEDAMRLRVLEGAPCRRQGARPLVLSHTAHSQH